MITIERAVQCVTCDKLSPGQVVECLNVNKGRPLVVCVDRIRELGPDTTWTFAFLQRQEERLFRILQPGDTIAMQKDGRYKVINKETRPAMARDMRIGDVGEIVNCSEYEGRVVSRNRKGLAQLGEDFFWDYPDDLTFCVELMRPGDKLVYTLDKETK